MTREPRALRAYSLMVKAVFHHSHLWARAPQRAMQGQDRYDALARRMSQVINIIRACAREC